MDVFDGADDPEDRFDQFVPHDEGTGLQYAQIVVLDFVQIQPPVGWLSLV